ncbi:MAG: hypothetical protein MUO24_02330 [Desulfobacterales bacterium]|nr:hypothetical protein [Desulfobacterales bacterium]
MEPEVSLATMEDMVEMRLARPPAEIMADAEEAARVLVSVVSRKPRKVMINNEQYLEFEDWQTVARFYANTVRVAWTRFLDLGGVRGYEAGADVLDRNGRVVSSAEAMCLNDEERWSARPKYEYQYVLKDGTKMTDDPPSNMITWEPNPDKPGKSRPKKERTLVGEEKVPFFQLRSMAQTRACAKALRNVFAWVVVLAGYRDTPAEEMTGNEQPGGQSNGEKKAKPEAPKKKDAGEKQPEPGLINAGQFKAITNLCDRLKVSVEGQGDKTLSGFLVVAQVTKEPKSLPDLTAQEAGEAISALQHYADGLQDGQAQ